MARAAQIKNPMLERQQVAMRVLVAALGIAVLTGVLGWRLISLQVIHHADYATRSDDNRMRPRLVAPVAEPRADLVERQPRRAVGRAAAATAARRRPWTWAWTRRRRRRRPTKELRQLQRRRVALGRRAATVRRRALKLEPVGRGDEREEDGR